ncbi:hypothetical protein LBMAG35_16660 [Chlorobiota bacterium]|nr:hypothetical protein LBMAG35_16660 [Chlorobiota bacterium]
MSLSLILNASYSVLSDFICNAFAKSLSFIISGADAFRISMMRSDNSSLGLGFGGMNVSMYK